jgi:hypothetical protein
VRTIYRLFLCLLMALFLNEMISFNNVNSEIANLSLMVGFVLLLEKLFLSITIEHIQNMIEKSKEKKKL